MKEVILSKQTEKQFEAKLKEIIKFKLNQIHYDISDISNVADGPMRIKVIDWTLKKEKKTTIDWDSILANIDVNCEYESLTDSIIVTFTPQINDTAKNTSRAMIELIDHFICSGQITYNGWNYQEALIKNYIIQTSYYKYKIAKSSLHVTTFNTNKFIDEIPGHNIIDITCTGKAYGSGKVKYTPVKIKRNRISDLICKPEIIQIEEYQELSDEQWQTLFVLNQIKGRINTTIVSELKQVLSNHSRFTKDEFIKMIHS